MAAGGGKKWEKKEGTKKKDQRKREESPRGAAATCRMHRYADTGREKALERTNPSRETVHTANIKMLSVA